MLQQASEPIDEDALYQQMKDLPDFLSYPIPSRWFKKYNIQPIEAGTTKEFIESNHAIKMMFSPKDLPPIMINEPQKDASGNIKFFKIVEPEKVEVKVVSRPYDPDAKPLPLDDEEVVKKLDTLTVLETPDASLPVLETS